MLTKFNITDKQQPFEQYFKLPFYSDEFAVYIFDKNNHPVFNWLANVNKETKEIILKKIDGFDNTHNDKHVFTHDSDIVYVDDKKLLRVRGWGRLTGKGCGACGLDSEEAIKIQTNLLNYVCNQLNK